ncbi:MAG TPA: DUF6527 family protein [Nocardioides sp.]|nr:DUF6527 family protein [Nocardioides sp.]
MSERAHYFGNPDAPGCRVMFRCPGCDDNHTVRINCADGWDFNGNLEHPTFTPSVLVHAVQWPEASGPVVGDRRRDRHPGVQPGEQTVCHSFVTEGRIQFLGDCTHQLAGQTVDLPPWHQEVS